MTSLGKGQRDELLQGGGHKPTLKELLYVIIFESDTPLGKLFDVCLLVMIALSIVLIIIESMQGLPPYWKRIFTIFEYVFTLFFTLEYLLRIYCSPRPREYVLSFFGIIDFLSTIPLYLGWIFVSARYLMVLRTFRLIRVFRVFKLFSFLSEGDYLLRSLLLSARKIIVFFLFAVILAVSLGTLMYMVEGGVEGTQFTDIPSSIYWAVATMATVGYGDIAPVTPLGRFLSVLVMLLGYTIIAVPTGIVSAEFIKEGVQSRRKRKCPECGSPLPSKASFCPHCGKKVATD